MSDPLATAGWSYDAQRHTMRRVCAKLRGNDEFSSQAEYERWAAEALDAEEAHLEAGGSPDDLLTIYEAAAELKRPVERVRRWVASGALRLAYAVQRTHEPERIHRDDLNDFRAAWQGERAECRDERLSIVAILGVSALFSFARMYRERLAAARVALIAAQMRRARTQLDPPPWLPSRPMADDARPPPTPERCRPAVMLTGPPATRRHPRARTT